MGSLTTAAIRNQVMLEGVKTHEVNQFASFLIKIDAAIREKLSGTELQGISRTRMEGLLAEIDKAMAAIYSQHYDQLAGHLNEIADYQAEFQAKSLNDTLKSGGFDIVSAVPAAAQVHASVFAAPLAAANGKLLEPFIKDWSRSERGRVTGAIRQGFFEGQTTNQILQIVRGTRKNKYSDGILAISNRNAEAVVRTSIQHTSSVARMETLEANSDIVEKYRIVATLDSRTSQICRSLDGQEFELGKGRLPPYHIRCRTTFVPVLIDKYKFLSEGRTRASKDGYVDGKQTYYDWLKQQPVGFQDKVLGPTRGKLFRDGGLNADRFAALNLDKNFQPMTLDEMRQAEPLAFEKADL